MRPADHPQRSKASALSTAAMLHRAAFDPLRGFPLASRKRVPIWVVVPRTGGGEGVRETAIDLASLREAATKIKVLWEHFPRALPRLVGDRERWRSGSIAALTCLRAATESRAPLPALPPSVDPRDVAGLPASFSGALAWTFAFDPSGLRAALRHRTRLVRAIEHIEPHLAGPADVARLIRWLELLADQPPRLAERIFELWCSAGAWTTATDLDPDEQTVVRGTDGDPNVQEALKRLALRSDAQGQQVSSRSLARLVFDQASVLAQARAEDRRRVLELLALTVTPAVVREWRVWREALRAGCAPTRDARARRALGRVRQGAPQHVERAWLDEFVRRLLSSDERVLTAASRVLARLPEVLDRAFMRLTLLDGWTSVQASDKARSEVQGKQLRTWLREFDAYVRRRGADSAALAPWRYALRTARTRGVSPRDLPVTWWQESASGAGTIQPANFFAALEHVSRRAEWLPGKYTGDVEDLTTRLMTICVSIGDAEQAAAFALALESELRASNATRRYDIPLHCNTLKPALALSGGSPHDFARLVILLALDESLEFPPYYSNGWFTPNPFEDAQARWLGQLALTGEVPLFRQLLRLVCSARSLAVDVRGALAAADHPPSSAACAWSPVLPGSVRDALEALARENPHVETAAMTLQSELVLERARLEQELRAIQVQLDDAAEPRRSHLSRRRDAIVERLAAPRSLNASAASKWLKKVEVRARHLRADAWTEALRAQIAASVERTLSLALPTEWWTTTDLHHVLAHLIQLPAEYRRLAGRMLAARASSGWSGYLDDPRNHAWISRMRRTGIDIDAWLRGPASRTVEHPRHGRLTLSVEDDPLQVLQMGAWFQTCLSPGRANFFSTVVIAADANKRLLCLRNSRGTALARCLLAIDQDRRVRLFAPYAHEGDLEFKDLAASVAAALGAAMGCETLGAGPIDVLTASNWYDDGEYEFERRLSALLGDPAVREQLDSGPDTGLADLLTAHLAPRLLDSRAAIVALQYTHNEFPHRLAGPLLDRIHADTVLERYERLFLLRLALDTRRFGLARRLLERLEGQAGSFAAAVARGWLSLEEPSRALRVLRSHRASYYDEESSGESERLLAEALANDQLRRHHRALALYRRVLALPHGEKDDVRQATERIAVLDAHLGK